MSKGVAIGLTNLHYAVMIADNAPTAVGGTDGTTTYQDPKRILGAITANFSPNASNDTLFADDGPYDSASTLGAMTLELNVADIPPVQRAELLGATYDDATGVLSQGATDIPPYTAVGMSVKKSNGADRLIWYLKGKFAAPDDSNQTKADSINWNTPTITGNFLKRDSDQQYRFSVDTDDAKVTAQVKDNWFKSPNVKLNTSEAVATPTATPATGTTYTAGTTTIALTTATAGAAIQYKLSTDSTFTAYSGPIATTGWTGSITLNVTATKAGMTSSTANFSYTSV